ncbi:Asp23/Gls24 family envelope stress response protein [Actinomycetospora atypica]|uniref:Asp23/Gls24 family envelope stress response protein n=1 Tax=Actinomycetospora atypica TaxID=1290095 RepID=A0ABV9YRZ4_9PSEU
MTTPATSTPRPASELGSAHGKTTIADAVVSKVAGLAAREIPGVAGFGGSASRALGAITERIPGGRSSSNRGVSVEVGETQAAIDLTIVVEYGVAIAGLATAIRAHVISAVEQMTGLQVVEVNIDVTDLQLPGDESDDEPRQPESARVR